MTGKKDYEYGDAALLIWLVLLVAVGSLIAAALTAPWWVVAFFVANVAIFFLIITQE